MFIYIKISNDKSALLHLNCSVIRNVYQVIKDTLYTFHSGFVGRDGGTFNRHMVLLSCQGRVDGDLVISLVAVRQTQVIVLQLDIHIGQDELKDTTETHTDEEKN